MIVVPMMVTMVCDDGDDGVDDAGDADSFLLCFLLTFTPISLASFPPTSVKTGDVCMYVYM